MKQMTSFIHTSGTAKTIGILAIDELQNNIKEVNRRSNWSSSERKWCLAALNHEHVLVNTLTGSMFSAVDSIHGDKEMTKVYTSYQGRFSDVVTLPASNVLVLSEMKYAIKFGGLGMFRAGKSFREMVSDKFLDMNAALSADGERVNPLRILVVNKQQLPFSMARVQLILCSTHAKGAYSSDGCEYDYVICASDRLRQMIDNPPFGTRSPDYLFFRI